MTRPDLNNLRAAVITAPPDVVLAGGTIDAQKGYPTADDTPEGRAHLTAHQSLSEVPLTIYRVRRDATWWVIVPDGTTRLTSLPGDIPGLLQRGAPLLDCGHPVLCREVTTAHDGTVRSIRHDRAYHADGRVSSFVLDLTAPAGRSLAARWAYHHPRIQGYTGLTHDEHAAMETALHYDDMTPGQVDTLARLVLRLAGRAA